MNEASNAGVSKSVIRSPNRKAFKVKCSPAQSSLSYDPGISVLTPLAWFGHTSHDVLPGSGWNSPIGHLTCSEVEALWK